MVSKILRFFSQSDSFFARVPLAILGGLSLASSFPAITFIPGAFLGIFLIVLAVRGIKFLKAFWLGLFAGFSFYGLVLIWLTTYLGPIPWFALSFMEAIFFAISFGVIAVVWRYLNTLKLGSWKNTVVAFAIGGIYTGREFVSSHFPFGGLPWARIGVSQADNFLAKWAWGIDIAGLSWLIVFISALLALQVLSPLPIGSGIVNRVKSWTPTLTAWLIFFTLPALFVLPSPTTSGALKVAAVQGNANAGLFAHNPPGSILDKHLRVAKKLIASGKAKNLDLMVWPENSADLDPINVAEENVKVTKFVNEDLKAPLLFGNKTFRGVDYFNEVDLWNPVKGLTDWYDKKRPVPFGEYVPYRSFFMGLAPDMIGLIGWDMSPGTRDGVFDIKKNVRVGSLICFEATIDELGYDLVDNGAQAIMIQTNSSDFGKSEQGVQLAGISRMRAIVTGRTVVAISTVGLSGIYTPDGHIVKELPMFTPAAMVANISLRSDKTPAVIFGRYIEAGAFVFAIALFLIALIGLTIARARRRA